MCPGLRGESGTGQETNRSSPGCADTGPLCNLGAASRPLGLDFACFFPQREGKRRKTLVVRAGGQRALGSSKPCGGRGGGWCVPALPMGRRAASSGPVGIITGCGTERRHKLPALPSLSHGAATCTTHTQQGAARFHLPPCRTGLGLRPLLVWLQKGPCAARSRTGWDFWGSVSELLMW